MNGTLTKIDRGQNFAASCGQADASNPGTHQ